MPARSTRNLRRTAAVAAALSLAGAPAAFARPADQGPASAAGTPATTHTIIGHHVPDALSMNTSSLAGTSSQTPDATPTKIVGHRVPDAVSMSSVPVASHVQRAGDSGTDSTPWIIGGAGVVALALSGGLVVATRRGGLRQHHAGI